MFSWCGVKEAFEGFGDGAEIEGGGVELSGNGSMNECCWQQRFLNNKYSFGYWIFTRCPSSNIYMPKSQNSSAPEESRKATAQFPAPTHTILNVGDSESV